MINIDEILKNSYSNFHAKGLDYLCLKRTPSLTIKAYFFDAPQSQLDQLPELVAPHNHRYNFHTICLKGKVSNILYKPDAWEGTPYQEFAWDTPLLGGAGFTYRKPVKLRELQRKSYGPSDMWASTFKEIHTLKIEDPGTVLILRQYEDVVPVGRPTSTYVRGDKEPQAPHLSGLYDDMYEDTAVKRINQLRDLGMKVDL